MNDGRIEAGLHRQGSDQLGERVNGSRLAQLNLPVDQFLCIGRQVVKHCFGDGEYRRKYWVE